MTLVCSIVIPTIGRSTLARAVNSVLEQDLAVELEVIVVNDSGQPLPAAAWQDDERVQVLHTPRRERCVARNTGAAIARGRYLHFLDDDDWLLPGALAALWQLAQQNSDTAWLYGVTLLVDRDGKPLIRLDHGLSGNIFAQVMAGEWIPLQSSWIEVSAFFAVGGFGPLDMFAGQDTHLCRMVALQGRFDGASELISCVGMGQAGSSTQSEQRPRLVRRAREDLLDKPGVLTRLVDSMRASTEHRDYWPGRVVRVYLTSMIWNFQRRRPFTAISRAWLGMVVLALSGWHLISPDFWQALLRKYKNLTFARGSQGQMPSREVSWDV